jgi:hypothetical protein
VPAQLRAALPLAVVSLLSLAVADLAQAHGVGTTCRVVKEDVISPGLSLQGSSGTFRTVAQGVITCVGEVNGYEPTGAGTFTERGRYGHADPDTCIGKGEAEGEFAVSIPTAKGVQKVTREFRISYGEPSVRGGVVAGKIEGNDFYGHLDAIPLEGDCVLRPVTRIHAVQELVFFPA